MLLESYRTFISWSTFECSDNQELSFSQRLSLITVLIKTGDKTNFKNSPVSLTNTDYKIIAFNFARRIQKVIYNLKGIEHSANI